LFFLSRILALRALLNRNFLYIYYYYIVLCVSVSVSARCVRCELVGLCFLLTSTPLRRSAHTTYTDTYDVSPRAWPSRSTRANTTQANQCLGESSMVRGASCASSNSITPSTREYTPLGGLPLHSDNWWRRRVARPSSSLIDLPLSSIPTQCGARGIVAVGGEGARRRGHRPLRPRQRPRSPLHRPYPARSTGPSPPPLRKCAPSSRFVSALIRLGAAPPARRNYTSTNMDVDRRRR